MGIGKTREQYTEVHLPGRIIARIMLALIGSLFTCIAVDAATCAEAPVSAGQIAGYDLTRPSTVFILPDILMEISDLTEVDTTSFACIQDEKGVLFLYDAVKNEIKKQYAFHRDGDYEGITRVGGTVFVLRSDGTLFEVSNYEATDSYTTSYPTGIPANNSEGLCYDPDNDRLLLACKGKIGKGRQYKDQRVIYAFDLHTKTLSKEPVYDFDLKIIKKFAVARSINISSIRSRKRGRLPEPIIRFRTSAIAIHPLEKRLYLLSSVDRLLFVFDMKGTIEHIELLDPVLFNQAEGITFFKNGDMLITNEGQGKKPTLLRFNYRKQ